MSLQFSTLNNQQIGSHQLNNSPTKQRYTIPKQQRFKKPQPECPVAFYNFTSQKMNRSTSFGYGSKSDFTKSRVCSPAPVTYSHSTQFSTDQKNVQKGKSFGVSRHQMKENGHIVKGIQKNPGVGNYQLDRSLGNKSYSFRPKSAYLHNAVFLDGKRTYQEVPGPGKYEQEQGIKKDGKHFFSKYKSSGATTINPPSSKRFLGNNNGVPGPNTYQITQQTGINFNASYTSSKHKSNGRRAMGHDRRITFTDTTARSHFAPGPGSYRIPSEFGIYETVISSKSFLSTRRN